jgi:hypothetical protein
MDIGTVLLMLGLSYALGRLWYDLLPGRLPERVWRVGAHPFLGLYVGEVVPAPVLAFAPKFGGIHLPSALIGSVVGVIVDWVVTQARHPAMVLQPEPQAA